MKKKMLIYCILFACLILFLFRAWNGIRKNGLKINGRRRIKRNGKDIP